MREMGAWSRLTPRVLSRLVRMRRLLATPDDPRVKEVRGMCSHAVDLGAPDAVDDAVRGWIAVAYRGAG